MLKLEPIDQTMLRVESLNMEQLPEVYTLWKAQYLEMWEKYAYLPQTWLNTPSHFSRFIERHIKKNAGIVVTLRDAVIGFMVYDVCDFHGEKTAFFPIMAHAAAPACQLVAYSAMYNRLSQGLVDQGCLNHIVMFFSGDQALQRYLFELGFGLYVVDAYRGLEDLPHSPTGNDGSIRIRQATEEDFDELFALLKESDAYYAEAPLFLKREGEGEDEVLNMLTSPEQAVFVATADNQMVGFMNVRCHDETDVINLSDITTAMLDPLGAYIKKEYRGRGLGKRLLHEVIIWSRRQNVTTIHVDFESANFHANQFWPRYFTHLISSVKRRLNADVI